MALLLKIFMVLALKNLLAADGKPATRPNVIFIYADDLAWNDVSFHGSPQIPTPNIDALAMSGIMLNNYYGQCKCTPSRASLLTGAYPIRTGLQSIVLDAGQLAALPLEMTIMPQHFKKLGYATHMVGKWNLGYMKKEYTPIYRGFDTFFGYYNPFIDYYDYTYLEETNLTNAKYFFGIDLHNGTTPVTNFRGTYATHVFSEKAESIILNHDKSKPLFLYLAHTAPHVGNSYMPLQAPPEIIRKFHYIKNETRRTVAAMVSCLDDSVGRIVAALNEKGILKNSVIVLTSDNGGDSTGIMGGYSSNYPLRGEKLSLWEGGVRLPAIIWSPLLGLKEPRVSKQLMHVSDWLPTLYTAAGGKVENLGEIDGVNMWSALRNGDVFPRTVLLHAIDPICGMSALRVGDMKVINGTSCLNNNGWYGATGLEDMERPASMDEWVFQHCCKACEVLKQSGLYLTSEPDKWRKDSSARCKGQRPAGDGNCDPSKKPCLFNITSDPCEYFNLADEKPKMVASMMSTIYKYQRTAVKAQQPSLDPRANPLCHRFIHLPWLDLEYFNSDCAE